MVHMYIFHCHQQEIPEICGICTVPRYLCSTVVRVCRYMGKGSIGHNICMYIWTKQVLYIHMYDMILGARRLTPSDSRLQCSSRFGMCWGLTGVY